MAGPLHDLPELHELSECDLAVAIEVHCVEEFIGWDLAEADSFPMLLSLCAVDGLVVVFVENFEGLCNNRVKLWWECL